MIRTTGRAALHVLIVDPQNSLLPLPLSLSLYPRWFQAETFQPHTHICKFPTDFRSGIFRSTARALHCGNLAQTSLLYAPRGGREREREQAIGVYACGRWSFREGVRARERKWSRNGRSAWALFATELFSVIEERKRETKRCLWVNAS